MHNSLRVLLSGGVFAHKNVKITIVSERRFNLQLVSLVITTRRRESRDLR